MNQKRPKKKSKVSHTTPISARLDPDVREAIEAYAKEKDITFSRALETLARFGLEGQKEITRTFGGEHNLALGWLVARITVGIEHKRKSSWSSDPVTLFYALLAICAVLRGFLPPNLTTLWNGDARTNNFEGINHWDEVASEIRAGLDNPDQIWWPLSDGLDDEMVQSNLPIGQLMKLIQCMPRHQERLSKLHPIFSDIALTFEEFHLKDHMEQSFIETLEDAQSEFFEKGSSPDDYSFDDLTNLIARHEEKRHARQQEESPDANVVHIAIERKKRQSA